MIWRSLVFASCAILLSGENVAAQDGPARSTVRAVRVNSPLHVDGKLNEAVYALVRPITDFIQQEPREGAPATERTEVWVFFDRTNVYVSARCWESQPERRVANELRRDNLAVVQNDNFASSPRHVPRPAERSAVSDHAARRARRRSNHQREGLQRRLEPGLGPLGRRVRRRLDGGGRDSVQIASLHARGHPGVGPARATNQQGQERGLVPTCPCRPRAASSGALGASMAATLVGIEAPPAGRNLEVKPYMTSNLGTDAHGNTSGHESPRGRLRIRC